MPRGFVIALGSVALAGCAALLGIDEGAYGGSNDDDVPSGPPAEMISRLQSGLRAYWRFEGNGADSTDAGLALSSAKPELTPSFDDAGRVGAGWLPGLAEGDDCKSCNLFEQDASAPELRIQGDFTISLWVRPDPNPVADHWLEYGIFDNDQVRIIGEAFNVSPAPCHPAVFIMKNGTPVYTVRDTMFDFRSDSNRGRWNHVLVFRRGVTLALRINQYLSTTTQTAPGGEGPAGTFRVGGMSVGGGWQGAVDELGIWNRALEADEIDALYNRGRGVTLFP